MAYNYSVEKCNRCGEHFKREGDAGDSGIFPTDLFGTPKRISLLPLNAWPADELQGTYCPSCQQYRNSCMAEAKRSAERDLGRRSYRESTYVCSECNGSGSLHGFTCPNCEGKGRLSKSSPFDSFQSTIGSSGQFEAYKNYLPRDFFKK